MLITSQNVICMDDEQYDLSSSDINSIFHVINSQCRTPNVDYWLPICLSSIATDGFLNIYYRNVGGVMGVVLLSTANENIADAVMMCQKIEIVV